MRVIRGREGVGPSEELTETFTGHVRADKILSRDDGVMVMSVVFAPGARTHWHTHELGQVLLVTHGRGLVSTGAETHWVVAGDVVHFPPGEEHWHGAGPDSFLVHTAVSIGATDWLTPVKDDEYAAAHG
jgi:quercetin dioxygenase-like cupin family protein